MIFCNSYVIIARSFVCVFEQCCSVSFLYVCMVNTTYLLSFVETPRKFIIAELSIRKLGSSSVLIIIGIISTDEDPSLRIESSAIINLRGVSTKLNKYNVAQYFLFFKTMSKIPLEHSAQIRAAYQLSKVRGEELLKLFPQYSKAAVYKHAKKPLNGDPVFDKRKQNKGRPKKLSPQDERSILRAFPNFEWRLEISLQNEFSWKVASQMFVIKLFGMC